MITKNIFTAFIISVVILTLISTAAFGIIGSITNKQFTISSDSTTSGTILDLNHTVVNINVTLTGDYLGVNDYKIQLEKIFLYNITGLNFSRFPQDLTGLQYNVSTRGYTNTNISDTYAYTDNFGHAGFTIKFTKNYLLAHAGTHITFVIVDTPGTDSVISPTITIFFLQPGSTDNVNNVGKDYFNIGVIGMFIIWFIVIFSPYILFITFGLGIKLAHLITIVDITIIYLMEYVNWWFYILIVIICIESLFLIKED